MIYQERSCPSESKEQAAEMLAGRSLEDIVQGSPDGLFRLSFLLEVHEKVAFDEDLVVDAIDGVIRMVMADQEGDALDDISAKTSVKTG